MSKLDQTTWIVTLANLSKGAPPILLPDPEPIVENYSEEDCHIFIANGNEINLPCEGLPIFVSVNDVDATPTSFVTRTVEVPDLENETADGEVPTIMQEAQTTSITANPGDKIHAIFDWSNPNYLTQNWFNDILQFGSRSVGGEPEGYTNPTLLPSGRVPKQLKKAYRAFYVMEANPAIISNLDVSNLTATDLMFSNSAFNQDLSGWDTSNVKDMKSMFEGNFSFNQDLSEWDTSNVTNMRYMFYRASIFRGENISNWDTSNVTDMECMFEMALVFNQDISQWCVSKIGSKPNNFDKESGFEGETEKHPQWGTCPRGENGA